jgi:tRNA 2-thiouridine synthesizing protein A
MEAATSITDTDIEIAVDKSLDCTGDLCPMPIYKASLALAKMQAGEVLLVRCTDRGSVLDFPAFANQARHELLEIEEPEEGVQVFYLRKGGAG